LRPRLRAGADAEGIVDAGLLNQCRVHATSTRAHQRASPSSAPNAAAAAVPAAVAARRHTGGGEGGSKKSARLQLSEANAPSHSNGC
jgi:hypothetical protein